MRIGFLSAVRGRHEGSLTVYDGRPYDARHNRDGCTDGPERGGRRMAEQKPDESWRGRVGRMDEAEVAAFLAEGVIFRLGCLDEEGGPYVVPVWFHYADG